MPHTPLRSQRYRLNFWSFLTAIGVVLYAALSVVYLFVGQLNGDEGWYLYASKLVYTGRLPYRDFAFTQMPLVPYVYGLPQALFQPGLYLGRATSLLFSAAGFAFSVSAARRVAGERAGAMAALLLATFTYGIYYHAVVKTYPMLFFFLAVTFWLMYEPSATKRPDAEGRRLKLPVLSRLGNELRYPLAIFFSACAVMVRLSALPVFVAVIACALLYGLLTKNRKLLLYAAATTLLIAIAAAIFFAAFDFEAAVWNVVTFHVAQWSLWGDPPTSTKISFILDRRIPEIFDTYQIQLMLILATSLTAGPALFRLYRKGAATVRAILRRYAPALALTIGLIFFAASHLVNGVFYDEYLVPAITLALPMVAVLLSKVYQISGAVGRFAALAIWGAALILAPIRLGNLFVDLSGGRLPIDEVKEVAAFVAEHTAPDDEVFVLQALWVALEAQRPALPGMTLAQFSYQGMSTEAANQHKVVNFDMLLSYIENEAAKIVIFTDLDWRLFWEDRPQILGTALVSRYDLVFERDHFGQSVEKVYVYQRRW